MNQVAAKHAAALVSRLEEKGEFDPGLESSWLTFMVICETAFEPYEASDEEFSLFPPQNESYFP